MSGKARGATTGRGGTTAPGDRPAERLWRIVRALLDARDEDVVIFGVRGDIVYLNAAAEAARPPASLTPFVDPRRFREQLMARGGRVVPLRSDGKAQGEMIVVPRPQPRSWAEQERETIHVVLHETGGRRLEAARRLGISRTTLWRRLRAERG